MYARVCICARVARICVCLYARMSKLNILFIRVYLSAYACVRSRTCGCACLCQVICLVRTIDILHTSEEIKKAKVH